MVDLRWAEAAGSAGERNLYQKIIEAHLGSGVMKPGSEIGLIVDSTLTQDGLGVMAYLQYEAIGLPQVRTKLSLSYVDHQTLQDGFENADDHRYLETVADRYGILHSRPGNGICHQVHLERFSQPEAAYAEMAKDRKQEKEAAEWAENTLCWSTLDFLPDSRPSRL